MSQVTIHTVEPKFLQRALRNGALLHFQHPFLFLMQIVGLSVLLLLGNETILSFFGFMFFILLFTWSFLCSKTSDSDSTLYQIIMATLWDIYGILKYSAILSAILAFCFAILLVIDREFIPRVGHIAPAVHSLYTQGIYNMSYNTTMLMLSVLLFGIIWLPMIMVPYLAMYYGYIGFNHLYSITTVGILKNRHTIAPMLLVVVFCILADVGIEIALPSANDVMFVFCLESVIFVVYATIAYLLCREIFEGRGKNVEVKAKLEVPSNQTKLA